MDTAVCTIMYLAVADGLRRAGGVAGLQAGLGVPRLGRSRELEDLLLYTE